MFVVLFAGFFIFLLYKVLEVRRKKQAIGIFEGETAETIDEIGPDQPGYVRFRGELWKAKSDMFIPVGTKVTIEKKDGAVLTVHATEEEKI